MRVSLSSAPFLGDCSYCGDKQVNVVEFALVAENAAATPATLCQRCLFEPGGRRVTLELAPLVTGRAPRRKALKKNRRRSRQQEQELAEELSAKTQPNSGAMSGAKGDVRKKDRFRLEAKFTEAATFALHLDDLHKIAGECTGYEKPVFVIDFLEPGSHKLKDRFAVLHFEDTKELLHAPGEHR